MKKVIYILALVLIGSCAEKLLEKPDNLIPKDKMVEILNDLAILNAAKASNVMILRNHDIEPMQYIFAKYAIDSVQFVESDRYYASIPEEHEKIYIAVEAKLEQEEKRLLNIKEERDSIKGVKIEASRLKKKTLKDSLLQIGNKKNQ